MAVKDWIPVAQDIYDALIADGNPVQNHTIRVSHKDLCKILDKHCVIVTEAMNKQVNMIEESFLVSIVRSAVRYKDLSKPLYENGLFKGDLTDAEESSAYSSHNVPKSMWVYQIAHKLQSAFKDPISFYENENEYEEEQTEDQKVEKTREEIIKNNFGFSEEVAKAIENEKEISEAKENAKKDVEDLVKSTKRDKRIKICSEIIELRRKLGAISITDLAKIIGNELFSNETSMMSSVPVPGDRRYIKVLEILNNISSIVYTLSTEISLEEMLEHVEKQFDKLDEIAESFKKSDSEENSKFNLVLEYLNSIKTSGNKIHITDLLKAFVVGEIIADESEYTLLIGSEFSSLMMRLGDLINAANFDIKDKTQVATGKTLLSAIKQAVSQNKSNIAKMLGGFTAGKPFPPPPLPGIDQKIYQKAAAFDKIVEALRPVFIELQSEGPLMKGFGSPLNGWGSPFNMNPMFKV